MTALTVVMARTISGEETVMTLFTVELNGMKFGEKTEMILSTVITEMTNSMVVKALTPWLVDCQTTQSRVEMTTIPSMVA